MQTVFEMVPGTPARQLLGSTIEQATDAIAGGRDAVRGLRASTTETSELTRLRVPVRVALDHEQAAQPSDDRESTSAPG